MEGKKKYIAIILFLLIGLGIFSFASAPEEEYGNSKGDGTNTQQTTTTTKPVDKDVLAQETDDDDQEETNNNRRPSSSNREEDNSYELALEAVKELEKVLTTEQAKTAKDLVEKVTNTSQHEELMNRVTTAENAITAEKLVQELERMVADALAKADIEAAVDHRDEIAQPAVDAITGDELDAVKEALAERIKVLNKILNDSNKPEIEGVTDGANVNTDVTLTITDENEVTKKVTKDGSEYEFEDTFTEEGTYEVTVLDSAFNEETITFTIDKTDPLIEGVENGANVNTDVTLTITDATFTTKKATKDGKDYEYKDTFTEEGTYVIVVTDDAGNDSEITFTIDKTPAKFLGLSSREAYVDSYIIDIEDQTEVTIMIKKNHAKDWTEVEEGTEITEEGTYQILATDAAGNTSDTWVIIDETKPTIEGIEGELVSKAQTITVFDRYLYTVEINGKKYTREDFTHNTKNEDHKFVITLSEDGVYTIIAKDKSGKTTTKEFEIDSKFAGIQSANMYTSGKNYIINKVPYYYATNGNTITAYIRTKEQLGQLPTFTFHVNGKDYPVDGVKESFHKPEDKEAGIYKYEVKFELTEEVEMEDGELTFTVTNIVDKAGNKKETPVQGVTNVNVNIIDRKSAGVKSNDFYVHGKDAIDKVFYTNKDNKITVNIKTDEQLRQIPTFTLHNNGKDYVLTDVLDRGENAPGVWLYQASYVITDEMTDGEITFTISDIYDLAGNKTDDLTKASNSRRIILDNTPNRIVETSLTTNNQDKEDKKVYYVKNGDTINFQIGFKELLGGDVVVKIGGKQVEFGKPQYFSQQDKYVYRGTVTIPENETELKEGQLDITIENVTDKAGHKEFYYETNGIKLYPSITREDTTNGRTVIYDRTPNRLKETSIDGENKDEKVYYIKNGDTITLYARFSELLGEDAVVKVGGKEVKLTYDHYFTSQKNYQYKAEFTMPADEVTLEEGQLDFYFGNITDKAGHKTFYYQTNGIKLYSELTTEETTNGKTLIYDRTPNRVKQTSVSSKVSKKVDKKDVYYITKGSTIDFSIGFSELLRDDVIVKIGGKEVKVVYDKYYEQPKVHLYKGTLTIPEDETEIKDGYLDIEIENVTDKAGHTIFTYKNAAKTYDKLKTDRTTNEKRVFYDTTAPVVTPSYTEDTIVEDSMNEYTKEPEFAVEDNSGQEVTKELISGKVNPNKLGTYELVYRFTDILGNYTDVTITVNVIDTLPPEISEVTNGAFYTSKVKPIVTDKHLKGATITHKVLGEKLYTSKFISGTPVFVYGEYTITAEDTSGNKAEPVTFVIDNVKPKILLLDKLEYIQSNIIPIKPIVIEEYLDTITITREYKDILSITHTEDIEFKVEKVIEDGKVISKITTKDGNGLTENGKYTITATDKAGNVGISEFIIDNENPVILQDILNGGVYKEFSIKVLDENYDEENVIVLEKTKSIPGIGGIELPYYERYDLPSDRKLTEEGEYLVVVYDKAYNISVARVIIDRTAPTSNIKNNGVYKELTPTVEDANLDASSVKLYKNNKKVDFTLGNTITTAGEYRLEAYDKARNELVVYFVIDREPPVIKTPSIASEIGAREEKLNVTTVAIDDVDGEITIKPTVTKEYNGSQETLYDVTELDISTPGVKYTLVYTATDKVGNTTETPVTIEFTVVEVTYEFVYSGETSKVYDKTDSLAAIKEKIVFNKVEGGNVTKVEDATIEYTITKDGQAATKVENAGEYVITAKTTYKEEEYEMTVNYTVQKAILTVKFADLVYGDTLATIADKVELLDQKGNKLDITATVSLYKYEKIIFIGTFPTVALKVEEGKYFYTVLLVANDNYEINDKVTVDLYFQKLDIDSASKSEDYTITK